MELAEALAGTPGATVAEGPDDAVDLTRWRLRLPVSALIAPDVLSRLEELPLAFTLTIEAEPGEVSVAGPRSGRPTVQVKAPVFELIEEAREATFVEVAAAGNVAATLRMLVEADAAIEAGVTLEAVNRPSASEVRWIRSTASLLERLRESWVALLEDLFEGDRRRPLVVGDAGAAAAWAPGLRICGPRASPPPPGEMEVPEAAEKWRGEHRRELPWLPPPGWLAPVEPEGRGLEEVGGLLTGVARALTWFWLAAAADRSLPAPEVTFQGQRVATVRLRVASAESAEEELDLWDWAMKGSDPVRYESVQQAVAFAVFGEKDLERAARPALRNASTLLNVLRKDAVAEAMATRRSARESAIGAAQAAAEAGRTAGAKALERVLVQAAAAAGIVIAQSGDALSSGAATRLLLLVLALLVASGVVALRSDYPSAYAVLDSFSHDLGLYDEVLSTEDIERIRGMRALGDARRRIGVSKEITVAVLAAAAAALVVALIAV